MLEPDEWQQRFVAQVERVRLSGALGKSAQTSRLFEFLVERSLTGHAPKEIEIAREVFGYSHDAQLDLNATVRANVHRLRKKLEGVPAAPGSGRLLLPRGEYRLVLAEEDDPAEPVQDGTPAEESGRRRGLLPYALLLVLAVIGVAIALRPAAVQLDRRLDTAFWRSLAGTAQPTLLVSGDHYVFGEVDANRRVARMIRDPAINSREDLGRYAAQEPNAGRRFVDMNYHDLPEGMAAALSTVAPIVHAATARGGRGYSALTTSRFTTDMLGGHNIVYVGLLGDLHDLNDPLFERSSFTPAPNADALVDRRTGRAFQSDWADPSEERILRRDYAYVASMRGPAGTRMLVVAGIRDPALVEAAQIVASPEKLAALQSRVGGDDVEALYEVRTFGPSNVVSRLVAARPLRAATAEKGAAPGR